MSVLLATGAFLNGMQGIQPAVRKSLDPEPVCLCLHLKTSSSYLQSAIQTANK